jgi:L-seryl-tRNA(Ser) seleniumtransferase
VLSRGQMVEIGDGFRVATMAAAGGCRIVAVGSTNRTHPADYEAALAGTGPDTAGRPASAMLWVHLSNFSQAGFVKEVPLSELAALSRARGVPLVADLGSGSLGAGLPDREPTIGRYLEDGADLVLVSGDKLLGGPQAGILAGRRALVERCRRHPMARALRPDKTTIAALHATLLAHARPDRTALPLHEMVAAGLDELQARGETIAAALGWARESVVPSTATIGGGSLPGDTLESRAVRVPLPRPSALAARLRLGAPAVVGRIEDGALLLDLRTVAREDDQEIVGALRLLGDGVGHGHGHGHGGA